MSKFLGGGGFNPALSPQRQAGQPNGSPPMSGAPSHPMSIPTVAPASARAAHHSPASNSPLGTSPHSPLLSSGAIPIPSSSAAVAARFGQPRAFNAAAGSSPNSGAAALNAAYSRHQEQPQNLHALQQQQQLQHVQAASAASIAVPPAAVARHKLPLFHNPFLNYAPPNLSSSVPTSHAHAAMYFNPTMHMTHSNAFLFTPQPLQQQPQQQANSGASTASVQASASSSPQSASPAIAASTSASSQQPQQQMQPQQPPQQQPQQQQPQQQQQHSPQQPHQIPVQPPPQQQQPSHFLQHPQPQPQQQQSRSLPVSIPAFRRAISFVGLDQGFSLFGPDADTDLTGGASAKPKTQPTPPRIQNIGQLGQQLRQHLSGAAASSAAAAAAASSASAQSTAASSGPVMQRAASSTAMSDDPNFAPHSMLPEISSPPPTVFSFHDSEDHLQPQPGHDSPLTLNFDGIHVGTSQPLAAIPQNVPIKQPSPQPLQPGTIFHEPPFARWGPTLSSSAPSHLPSFNQLAYRRDSANSSIASSQAASKHISSRSSHAHAHRSRQHGGAHTPTTINSEDNRPSSGQGGTTTEQEWSPPADDDMLDENEVEARICRTFHGDGSDCSLSACSSCSGESSDFSVDLEQDFDVTLTFPQHRDEAEDAPDQAVKQRLNQAKRDHHNARHLHHRRLRMRRQIKQAREEERRGHSGATAGDDDWKSHQLNDDEVIRVGSYTQGERAGKIQRFLEKRRRRVWSKKILYSCRKNFADKRPRVGGRFVKLKDAASAAAAAAAAGGDNEGAAGDGFGVGAGHPSSGGGSLGGSLSTSPAPLSYGGHAPGFVTQHMHGALGLPHGGSLTAFSLPLSHYAHTNFSPIVPFGSPNPAAASSAAASSSQMDALSFLKQEVVAPTPASHMSSAPSGLAAALRPHALAATSPPFFS